MHANIIQASLGGAVGCNDWLGGPFPLCVQLLQESCHIAKYKNFIRWYPGWPKIHDIVPYIFDLQEVFDKAWS
ncbi:MAG: hypothetical protein ACREOW_13640 [Thermodesulfobacteriota bacterium]